MVHDYSDWCQVDADPLLIISANQLSEQHSINFWDALIVEAALRAGAVDAAELVDALRERYAQPDSARLTTVSDLAHSPADPPGLQPAPQLPAAKAVDGAMTQWFRHHLAVH